MNRVTHVSFGWLLAVGAFALGGCGGDDGDAGSASSQNATVTAPNTPTTVAEPSPAAQPVAAPVPTPAPAPVPAPAPAPVPTPTTNQAPKISGSAPTAVNAGSTYKFAPKIADADGDPLGFSIQNKPQWATFATSTGTLSGTPSAAEVGTYSNIVISVSDGKATSKLGPFSIAVAAISDGRATLSWLPPTENTDGSALTNLAGYRIYYGTGADALTQTIEVNTIGVSTYIVEDLSPATWYFTITAVTADGAESAQSGVASKKI